MALFWIGNSHRMTCAICGRPIDGWQFDMHEWMVTRASVPKAKQDRIFKLPNVVPLHHECHIDRGHKRESKLRCFKVALRVYGAEMIWDWYKGLDLVSQPVPDADTALEGLCRVLGVDQEGYKELYLTDQS